MSAAFRGVVSDRLEVLQSTCHTTNATLWQEGYMVCTVRWTHVNKHVLYTRCRQCFILLGRQG